MSVSHPFLRQLKVHVLHLCQSQHQPIRDDHEALQAFCHNIEDILKYGLHGVHNMRYATPSNYNTTKCVWDWISVLYEASRTPELSGLLYTTLDYCHKCAKTCTNAGRLRLWIRCALNKNLLSKLIRFLRQHTHILNESYTNRSIIGDDILCEIFLSLLAPIEAQVKFGLDVRACAFLDDTWHLPWYSMQYKLRQYELVPCDKIGVQLQVSNGRILVAEVMPNSVADEDLKIEPGDVIDDLFGEALRNVTLRRVVGIMSEYKQCPIYIGVIKAFDRHNEYYRPLRLYHDSAGIDRTAIKQTHQNRTLEMATGSAEGVGAYYTDPSSIYAAVQNTDHLNSNNVSNPMNPNQVKYLGAAFVGNIGTITQIQHGVEEILSRNDQATLVTVELTETEVRVRHVESDDKILLRHSFPEISSCGRRVDRPLNFAYIQGESTCTISKHFFCHVFEAESNEQAKCILSEIAAGFDRTHWAV